MRKSKSCEDIRVYIKRQHDAINVNSNALVSKLMKRSPCRKSDQKDQYDAYHWANLCNLKANYGNSIKDIEIVPYRKGNMRRTYSQEDLERLLNIQDELKVVAFQNICSKVPMKSRVPLKVTPKELAKLDDNTMKSRMKRSQLVKKVMMNTTQDLQKIKHKKKKEENSSYQSNRSITNTTIETFKGSFQQESTEQKTIKLEKTHKFEKRLNKIDYNEVYNTERRKQAWKAYHEAERNKIIMMKPENCRKALITFINDSSNNGKPRKKNHKTMENEEGDGGFDTLRAFKEINQNFQDFSSNYKLSLK